MKKIISAAATAIMLVANMNLASAYTYPHAIWKANDFLAAAQNSGDNAGIAEAAGQIVDIMWNEPDCEEKRSTITHKLKLKGEAQAAMGDYAASAQTFATMYDYIKDFGEVYFDDAKVAKAKAENYAPELRIFSDGGESVYYGAINEKQNGVLFGVCENSATRSRLGGESMTLMYHNFGEHMTDYMKNVLKNTAEKGLALEYALNCPGEAADVTGIETKAAYLDEISAELAKYPDMPVYMRFGAEFDVWTNMADTESYKAAFRCVADYFHAKSPKVAMVWSPNYVSGWYTDINDFYPGDDCVDWVGVSLYAKTHFNGDGNDYDDLVFKAGSGSDPVKVVADIMAQYGDRKPIMISEHGASRSENGVESADFAAKKIREFEALLPMVYPQIKLMAYFDTYVTGEANDYRLTDGTTKEDYIRLTRGRRFIRSSYSADTDFCYRELWNGAPAASVFPLSCYAHIFDEDITEVSYFIDGEFVGSSNSAPYTVYVDAANYAGAHSVRALAAGSKGGSVEKSVELNIAPVSFGDIKVTVNGENVEFDRTPVILSGRTLVPMRAIFDTLGAEVGWDGDTKTASGTKDGKTVSISVDSNILNVNGEERVLDAPAIVLGGRTLVPARAIAEAFDCNVGWDATAATVTITK